MLYATRRQIEGLPKLIPERELALAILGDRDKCAISELVLDTPIPWLGASWIASENARFREVYAQYVDSIVGSSVTRHYKTLRHGNGIIFDLILAAIRITGESFHDVVDGHYKAKFFEMAEEWESEPRNFGE